MNANETDKNNQSFSFKAETIQLLDILIHSLYTEREVFLRELISNASDALTRLNYEMLTNRNVVDPDSELGIWITSDQENKVLRIKDTGIGMAREELIENLGTIAHSGAKTFIQAAKQDNVKISDLIGQFGVGFYSAFMVADSIEVISRSYRPDDQPASWYSTGNDTYVIDSAEKQDRGSEIIIHLKEDASEFLQEYRIKEIIHHHSEYIPFPIYFGDKKEQVNRQAPIWRQSPRELEESQVNEFYKQLTMEFEPPLSYLHLSIDAPVQMYALLFVPTSPERSMVSLRKQEGVALYARKVLIQEYCKDLLPEFLRFITGIVDSEDLPLNVARESIQSNRLMAQLKKLLTSKVIDHFKTLIKDKPDIYTKFWESYGHFIKEGVALDQDQYDSLLELLRFHTLHDPTRWVSLSEYVENLKPGQTKIYYLAGEDERSISSSPHLEVFRKDELDVLYLTDPMVDPFMLLRFTKYKDFELVNVSSQDLKLPENGKDEKNDSEIPAEDLNGLVELFKTTLGERVASVRTTNRLNESPARLVDEDGKMNPELQRVYHLLNQEFEAPHKVLEINPDHVIIKRLKDIPENNPLTGLIIEQVYEDALLIEGLHPDPSSMIKRIQQIMEAAIK